MKLQEFVISDDSSEHLRHYFRFKNREAEAEEFIVIYRRAGGDMLRYARTHWRRPEREKHFRTLNERPLDRIPGADDGRLLLWSS